MSRYRVGDFGRSGALIAINIPSDDPRIQELAGAAFDFPFPIQSVGLCDSLGPLQATETVLAALLYAESIETLEEFGPGKCEPIGAVEFDFETGGVQTFIMQDEPFLKAVIDGKRRSWREKHARMH